MPNAENRRRNYRLFEFLVSRMSDAELRTMRECVLAEWSFRVSRVAGRQHMASEPDDEVLEPDEIGPDDLTDAQTPQALKVQRRRAVTEPPPPQSHPTTGQPLIRRPSGVRRAQHSGS